MGSTGLLGRAQLLDFSYQLSVQGNKWERRGRWGWGSKAQRPEKAARGRSSTGPKYPVGLSPCDSDAIRAEAVADRPNISSGTENRQRFVGQWSGRPGRFVCPHTALQGWSIS